MEHYDQNAVSGCAPVLSNHTIVHKVRRVTSPSFLAPLLFCLHQFLLTFVSMPDRRMTRRLPARQPIGAIISTHIQQTSLERNTQREKRSSGRVGDTELPSKKPKITKSATTESAPPDPLHRAESSEISPTSHNHISNGPKREPRQLYTQLDGTDKIDLRSASLNTILDNFIKEWPKHMQLRTRIDILECRKPTQARYIYDTYRTVSLSK